MRLKHLSNLFIIFLMSSTGTAHQLQNNPPVTHTNDSKALHIAKGFSKAPNYQPIPTILSGKNAWTNPDYYNHNQNWRESVYSGDQGQIVVMTISPATNPNNDVPNEVHDFDQFIFVQSGNALVSFKGGPFKLAKKGSWILAPAYIPHHIKNASNKKPLKILSIYTKWDTQQPTMQFKTWEDEQNK